ncbi:carboxymuconolactone decarboxylase family protein [Fodinicola feengrottensis]|uniref:Metallo-beta-lactamase domain-containing protein n=1 Tax=Fodinicola feengrottensis TaxID=435914 RepID=A0ABP4V8M9_9ACTN|nr:carboxymuconolactone decarboxylase family protein [Fodinicola feengrottensis]
MDNNNHETTRPTSQQDRRAAGLAVLEKLDQSGDRAALRTLLADMAPDFADLTVEVAYGDFWARPGLDLAQRELVTVAALCAMGRDRQLAGHIKSALAAGIDRTQIVEVLMQMAVYAGWPAAVNGLLAAKEVFAAHPGPTADGHHTFHVGTTRVTVVSDGHAYLPAAMFGGGIGEQQVAELLRGRGLPTDRVRISLNGLVLEHDDRLIVVDPGSGPPESAYAHGLAQPTQGRFLTHFLAAGFDPADVDLVLVQHGHQDHWGGLLTADGSLAFPHAQVGISEAEYLHWRDVGDFGKAQVPDDVAEAARAVGRELTAAIADRVSWLVDGKEVVPGLTAVAAPGHTCGHTALRLDDGGETLLIGGEFAHHEVIQLAEPDSYVVVDADNQQSRQSRRTLLHQAATNGWLVHAYHFSWPGLGKLVPRGDGWQLRPVAFS